MIFNITNEYIIEFQYNKNYDSGLLRELVYLIVHV